jgi:urease accessory protein
MMILPIHLTTGGFSMRLLLAAILALGASAAYAHTGVGPTSTFLAGFAHPLGGLDHLLAMMAVGMFAAALGGRAFWAVPLAFLALMAIGGAIGAADAPLPFAALGVAFSVVALGLAVAFARTWSVGAAMAFVGVFALFHGHAHGTDMPLAAGALVYAAGFLTTTAILHLIGLALALGMAHIFAGRRAVQLAGAAISTVGVGFLAGII